MRIVVITGDGPEHKYVTNRLAEVATIDAVLICDPAPRRKLKSFRKYGWIFILSKLLRTLLLRLSRDAQKRHHILHQSLGEEAAGFNDSLNVIAAGRARGDLLHDSLREIDPDLVLVYGTPIIPDTVLSLAKNRALNMHTGLSPWYRGTACAFWPVHDGMPSLVGATVHECTSDVDGGQIYWRKASGLDHMVDRHTAFAEAVKTGARGYSDVVAAFVQAGNCSSIGQDHSIGREFLGRDLGFAAEIRYLHRQITGTVAGNAGAADDTAFIGQPVSP